MTSNQPKQRLRAHFGFSKVPFRKAMWAAQMFDSQSQRELLHALSMWLEVRGFALVTGPSGVGKSITLRRLLGSLDNARFRVIDFPYVPSTTTGFLRSLSRKLGLPTRAYGIDMFDAVKRHLADFEKEHGPHPLIVLDDAEGIAAPIIDTLRRLSCIDLDAEDHFSVLLSSTELLLGVLRDPISSPLRSRIAYTHALRPFGLEDTQNYVRFHLQRADVNDKVFSDEAIKRLFTGPQGKPRSINQLAVQALIDVATAGQDAADGKTIARIIAAHPLYQNIGATET
jgi:type II secretory pathway predicted ATPase ExeA